MTDKTAPNPARRYLPLGCLLLGLITALPAAAQRCGGTYAATALHPLPQPVIAALDIRDNSPENQRLAESFMQGMRGAGTKTQGPTTTFISIYYSLLGLDANTPSIDEGPGYSDFSALSGGISRDAPAETRMRLRQPAHPHGPVTLTLRAEAAKPGNPQVLWVMSLQCQMTEQEPTQLAFEIGRLVGSILGKTVPRQAF